MTEQLIFDYFPDLTTKQREQITALLPLYTQYNEKVNVISRKDIENLYERHVLHALGIAKVVRWHNGTQVLDVGTGGGFPGIPLAILYPSVSFVLVDSIGKKIKVVQEVAQSLGLTNVEARQQQAQRVPETFDFVIARAVTHMAPFYDWIAGRLRAGYRSSLPNGILYLKGGDLTEELSEIDRPVEMFDLDQYFDTPFFATKKVVYVPFAKR